MQTARDCRQFSPWACKQPEAVDNFHHGHAKSLRLSAIFIMGMQAARDCRQFSPWACKQPEAVGNFHHGGAGKPETVRTFHHGGNPEIGSVLKTGVTFREKMF